jgi:hypothetical protein
MNEGNKTQQAIVFSPLQPIFSPLGATTQLALHRRNVFAPDQTKFKIFENRLPQRAQQAKRGHGSKGGRWSKTGGEARSTLNGGLSGILVKRVTKRVLWCTHFPSKPSRADRIGA